MRINDFDMWWDFKHYPDKKMTLIVEVNHPQYPDVRQIYEFDADVDGFYNSSIEWYQQFEKDVAEGRISIHSVMKELGHTKIKRVK